MLFRFFELGMVEAVVQEPLSVVPIGALAHSVPSNLRISRRIISLTSLLAT
jgi:hypothetical protein